MACTSALCSCRRKYQSTLIKGGGAETPGINIVVRRPDRDADGLVVNRLVVYLQKKERDATVNTVTVRGIGVIIVVLIFMNLNRRRDLASMQKLKIVCARWSSAASTIRLKTYWSSSLPFS